MNRTQIYLHESQMDQLRKRALTERTSVSETIRSIIDAELSIPAPTRTHESLLTVAKRINTRGTRAPRDLATHTDKYLYGTI